jgi:uncharacterized protein YbjT (DUF2867 family)
MIFITSATGNIGKELCRLLGEAGAPARAMCRKEEQLQQFRSLGLQAVLADYEQPETLRMALSGCKKMFLLTSPTAWHAQTEKSVIDMAEEAGIKNIVRLSTADANLSAKLAYARSHAEIDHYLRSKPLDWTILRPTGFMQNFIASAHPISRGILPHMVGDGQLSYIDLRDIGQVASQVLTQDIHKGATYYLTGPESLTLKNVTAVITAALGHKVKEVRSSEAEIRKALGYAGLSEWHINNLIEQFHTVAGGYEIDVTGEVERLTGQRPRHFAQFARDYKSKFLTH